MPRQRVVHARRREMLDHAAVRAILGYVTRSFRRRLRAVAMICQRSDRGLLVTDCCPPFMAAVTVSGETGNDSVAVT